MDKIILKGLRVFAFHGVNLEEKALGQPFLLDITVFLDITEAAKTDDLLNTVSYADIAKVATEAMQEGPFDLIESAAQHVANTLLLKFPIVLAVQLCVNKPCAPIKLPFENVAVEIFRKREDT